jgi:glycosyltransferase involved in cell wall biosynthesis
MQKMSFLFSDTSHPYAPSFPDPGIMRALRSILLKEQPDIVHAHNWLLHSFTLLKSWSKARFVVSLHDYSLSCVQKRLMRQETACSGPGMRKCLACSTRFYGFAKGPLSTLANFYWGERERQAVDLFLPVSQAAADGNQLFVGDVLFDKGIETLLQAYAGLHTRLPLVLIGRTFFSRWDSQLMQNVLLTGAWPHNAVMAAWKRCTIGLVPSIVADACPTVAMEAMVAGKPVIAGRTGGLTDIVADEETGLLVPPGDSQALHDALQSLLDAPERRERMGVLARQRVKRFQASSVVPLFEQVYRELLETDSPGRLLNVGSR